jgi:hypothetical protein
MYRPHPTSGIIHIPKSKVPKSNRAPTASDAPVPSPAQVALEKFKQQQREARSATELNEAILAADKEFHALESEALKDWRTAEDRFDKGAEDILGRHLSTITMPEARTFFERYFPHLMVPRRVNLRTKAVASEVAHNRQTLADAAEFYGRLAQTAATDFDREHAKQKFERLVENAVRGQMIRPEQADKVVARFNSRTTRTVESTVTSPEVHSIEADSALNGPAPTGVIPTSQAARSWWDWLWGSEDKAQDVPTEPHPTPLAPAGSAGESSEEAKKERERTRSERDQQRREELARFRQEYYANANDEDLRKLGKVDPDSLQADDVASAVYYSQRRSGDPTEPRPNTPEWRHWAVKRIYWRVRDAGYSDGVARAVILNALAESRVNMSWNPRDEESRGVFQIKMNGDGLGVRTGAHANRLQVDLDYNIEILLKGMQAVPELNNASSVEFAMWKLLTTVFVPDEARRGDGEDEAVWKARAMGEAKKRLGWVASQEYLEYSLDLPPSTAEQPTGDWGELSPN